MGETKLIPVDHDPFFDPRWVKFAKPGLVEDRRNDTPIDTSTWPRPDGELQLPNLFDLGGGTLSAFNPDTDFVPQPAIPSQMGIDAGVKDIKLVPVDHDPFEEK